MSTLEPPSGFESGSCVVDIDILITFRNGDRKIMRSVRITSRHPVTVCVMLRNNFQMLKKNCSKAKKDFPLPVFTIFIGLWVATFFSEFKNNLSFNLLVFGTVNSHYSFKTISASNPPKFTIRDMENNR